MESFYIPSYINGLLTQDSSLANVILRAKVGDVALIDLLNHAHKAAEGVPFAVRYNENGDIRKVVDNKPHVAVKPLGDPNSSHPYDMLYNRVKRIHNDAPGAFKMQIATILSAMESGDRPLARDVERSLDEILSQMNTLMK